MSHPTEHTFPPPRHHRDRSGFSLVELLVVIGIIVLVATAAVPAFRYITGARSTETALNLVSSVTARARNQALADQRTTGVFFFVDPTVDRYSLALVHGGRLSPGWTDGKPGLGTNWSPRNLPPASGQAVNYYGRGQGFEPSSVMHLELPPVANRQGYFGYSKLTERTYAALRNHAAATANRPPNATNWLLSDDSATTFLELVSNVDYERLPLGVGCQTVNDPAMGAGSTATLAAVRTVANRDRYLRTGVILFDSGGRLLIKNYDVMPNSLLGAALLLPGSGEPGAPTGNVTLAGQTVAANNPTGASARLFSQYGIILYDRDVFRNATDVNPKATAINFKSSEMDLLTQFSLTASVYPPLPAPAVTNEQSEEKWLDLNSLPLMVDRTTGALIRGE